MGYEIDRSLWWNRPIWDLANRNESRIRAAIARDLYNPDVRSLTVSHRSDANSSCDYYYSRAENAGPNKNETITEEHWRYDGKAPHWIKDRYTDPYWWSLRTPYLIRAHQLSIKPW